MKSRLAARSRSLLLRGDWRDAEELDALEYEDLRGGRPMPRHRHHDPDEQRRTRRPRRQRHGRDHGPVDSED